MSIPLLLAAPSCTGTYQQLLALADAAEFAQQQLKFHSIRLSAGTHLLLSQLAKHMEELAAYAISSYVGAVQEALPSNSKLPNHQYGAEGCFGYFEAKLADLSK